MVMCWILVWLGGRNFMRYSVAPLIFTNGAFIAVWGGGGGYRKIKYKISDSIDRSHVSTAIWWPLGVAVVSVTCMRVRWISHTWKYTQWNIFLFESSDKTPYWTNPNDIGFRYEASLNFHTYFGQFPNDIYILLHIVLSCLSKLPAHGANDCHGP